VRAFGVFRRAVHNEDKFVSLGTGFQWHCSGRGSIYFRLLSTVWGLQRIQFCPKPYTDLMLRCAYKAPDHKNLSWQFNEGRIVTAGIIGLVPNVD
jgi:hypothetical protein